MIQSTFIALALLTSGFPSAFASNYRSPREIQFTQGTGWKTGFLDRITLENFSHTYWLYKNECQTKSMRHSILEKGPKINIDNVTFYSTEGSSSQYGGIGNKLSYRRFYNDVTFQTIQACMNHYSKQDSISGMRITFTRDNQDSDFALAWSIDSDFVEVLKFDFDKNIHVKIGEGKVMSWYE